MKIKRFVHESDVISLSVKDIFLLLLGKTIESAGARVELDKGFSNED